MIPKIITEMELDSLFIELSKFSEKENTNPYDYYIQIIKTKRLSESEQTEKKMHYESHHIIPRFEKSEFTNDIENLVKVTVKKHVIAHWLRYKVFNKPQDLCAYLFRVGDTISAIELRNKLVLDARERDGIEKRYFSHLDFQSEMGKRGGKKGGSSNSEAQFLARQKVGQQFGRITGIGNQGETLKNFLANWSIWTFREKALNREQDTSEELNVLISPKKSFVEIFHLLKIFVPYSIEGKNPSTMHKLIYKQRPQLFGWRIKKTLTCSEAVKGIQDFYQDTSAILYFEEDLMINEDLE